MPGMTEVENTGEVHEEGINQNDEIGREGVPNDERGNDNPLQPVGKLPPAGLGDKGLEIVWLGRRQGGLWKSAEPWSGIGEQMFPSMNEEDSTVNV